MTQNWKSQGSNRLVLHGARKESKMSEVEVEFAQSGRQHGNGSGIIPTFNQDGLFFTPAFLLPLDQKYYIQNQTFQRVQFKEKIERNLDLTQDRKTTKNIDSYKLSPPNSNYCQVCQEKYQLYFTHIHSPSHLAKSQDNPINSDIRQLCQSFAERVEKETGKVKSRQIKKQSRSHKMEILVEKSKKNERKTEDCECVPRSSNHSCGLAEKETLQSLSRQH